MIRIWKGIKGYGYKREYCKYLKSFLDVQDQVKDCEVE